MRPREPRDQKGTRSQSARFDSSAYAELRRSRVERCRQQRNNYLSQRGMLIDVGDTHPVGGSPQTNRLLAILIAAFLFTIVGSAVLDGLHLVSGDASWLVLSHWGLGLGFLLGVSTASAVAGLLWKLRRGHEARRTLATMLGGSVAVSIAAAASWLARSGEPVAPDAWAYLLCFMAAGIAIVTGGLTGDLIGARVVSFSAGQQQAMRRRSANVIENVDTGTKSEAVAVQA